MVVPPEMAAISKKLSATFASRQDVENATEELGKMLAREGETPEALTTFAMLVIMSRLNRMEKRLILWLALAAAVILAAILY
jgi:hypothetical protein